MLTGIVMIVAGLLRLGAVLRFVSNAVMVGFINAVGVNIVLGQLANLTGYAANGPNRVVRAVHTLLHPGQLARATVGSASPRSCSSSCSNARGSARWASCVAVVVTSGPPAALGWADVATLNDLGEVPDSLPRPELPLLRWCPR